MRHKVMFIEPPLPLAIVSVLVSLFLSVDHAVQAFA